MAEILMIEDLVLEAKTITKTRFVLTVKSQDTLKTHAAESMAFPLDSNLETAMSTILQ